MVEYNHTRTAYKPSWSLYDWYLIPDGKKRAPLFGEGPLLDTRRSYPRLSDEHINLITNEDRVILLEAIAGGCFNQMWSEMGDILRVRSRNNFQTLKEFAERRGVIQFS